jgi:hypothetical protein
MNAAEAALAASSFSGVIAGAALVTADVKDG